MKLYHTAPAQNVISKISVAMAVIGMLSAMAVKADLVFDNMSDVGVVPNATGSTPNTFMGDGYVLAAGTTEITGFDVFPVNLSGTAFNSIKINIFVWGTVNTGTVNATTPLFGSLLGSYSLTSVDSFPSGSYFPFEGATPGVTPGISLGSPLAISSTTIGLTFNYQGSTDGGVTFANVNSLSSIIATGPAPTVGSLVFGSGYFRNANSEVNGNFTSTIRALAGLTNQGLGVRVYGTVTAVPEPTSLALIGGGAMFLLFRRRA